MTSGTHRSEGPFGAAATSWAHHSDLVMYARRVLGDRSDTAEDIVQEAYLRLLGLAASDEAPESARPWLFRVVRNLAIDERRSVARRADPVADTAILGTAALEDTAAIVEHRQELAGALREMSELPPRERRAIEMDQAGIGAQEIAAELGTTPNAVHQALFRARKRLRNARAVAWGLVPIGIAPLLVKATDPALAVTMTNLPPGMPVGRALPVAGLVAAAMVGGSVVAPNLSQSSAGSEGVQFAPATVRIVANDSTDGPRNTQGANRGPSNSSSSKSGPGPNSGKGNATKKKDDDDDSKGQSRNRNRGQAGGGDDDSPEVESSRSRNRGGGKAPATGGGGGDDDSPASGGGSKRGGGSGKSGTKPAAGASGGGGGGGSADDAPDAPDAPDVDEPDHD